MAAFLSNWTHKGHAFTAASLASAAADISATATTVLAIAIVAAVIANIVASSTFSANGKLRVQL